MSSSFRRLRAWLAIVAFTGTFGLGSSVRGHFGPDDDAACGSVALGPGHSGVQFATATTSPPATHCPFCHWQRAVSGASIVAADAAVIHLTPIALVTAPASRAIGSAAVAERPSRAPPLT